MFCLKMGEKITKTLEDISSWKCWCLGIRLDDHWCLHGGRDSYAEDVKVSIVWG